MLVSAALDRGRSKASSAERCVLPPTSSGAPRAPLLLRHPDGVSCFDEVGSEPAGLKAVRKQARKALPEIAREALPKGEDQRPFTVLVKDEGGRAVYSATLTDTEIWLDREP